MKKLHDDRGETLIEVLASIVIGSLSIALMFGCIMASSKMDEDAKALDRKYYLALTAADASVVYTEDDTGTDDDDTPQVTISNETSSVSLYITIYGGEGMFSYRRAEE